MINLFMGRTVASITASLSSMVKTLEDHAKAKVAEATKHQVEAAKAQMLADAATDEVAKAHAAAAKIGALFS